MLIGNLASLQQSTRVFLFLSMEIDFNRTIQEIKMKMISAYFTELILLILEEQAFLKIRFEDHNNNFWF